jgi:competence protein ComEA
MRSSTILKQSKPAVEPVRTTHVLTVAVALIGAAGLGACTDRSAERLPQASPTSAGPSSSSTVPAATKGSSTTGTTSESRSGAASARLVDINSATPEELNSLPDVGAERAQRIMQNRPYTRVEELRDRGILPKSVYDEINDRLVVR